MDNDWIASGFIPFLLALDAGMEILALASDTATPGSAKRRFTQPVPHGPSNRRPSAADTYKLALLEIGNLSCIPVVEGATYPLIQTPQRLSLWQQLWGKLQWQGVFAPENLTA